MPTIFRPTACWRVTWADAGAGATRRDLTRSSVRQATLSRVPGERHQSETPCDTERFSETPWQRVALRRISRTSATHQL